MRITTEHSRSSYGVPVILDDDGEVVDYGPGVAAVRASLGITQQELAAACGVGVRAVQSWEQGWRPVGAAPLNVMASLLARIRAAV